MTDYNVFGVFLLKNKKWILWWPTLCAARGGEGPEGFVEWPAGPNQDAGCLQRPYSGVARGPGNRTVACTSGRVPVFSAGGPWVVCLG